MRSCCQPIVVMFMGAIIFSAMMGSAYAAVTITGTTEDKCLVSEMPVTTTTAAVFKITFENKTSGTSLQLCAGKIADFTAAKCAMPLSHSGGPGFQLLTIVDAEALEGEVIYVIRSAGTKTSQFILTIE